MSDGIIDIGRFLEGGDASREKRGAFALWGAEGERSRFALPLWRIVYIAGGRRGAILRHDMAEGEGPRPFVVLDLEDDPAKLEFADDAAGAVPPEECPSLLDLGGGGLVVQLGVRERTSWTLRVDGGEAPRPVLGPKAREDVLFLAGECAGLLFHRDLIDAGLPGERGD